MSFVERLSSIGGLKVLELGEDNNMELQAVSFVERFVRLCMAMYFEGFPISGSI